MTINEFKAFIEGMDVKECPTPEQWGRIREKIDQLSSGINSGYPAPNIADFDYGKDYKPMRVYYGPDVSYKTGEE